MSAPEVLRFEPVPHLRDRLRRTCTADDGLCFADVRWYEEGQCLAIYELRQDRQTWIVRQVLRDSNGQPRQVDERDLEACERDMAAARNAFDKHWYEREVEAHNAAVDAKVKEEFDAEVADIQEMQAEMARRGYCWHGDDPNTCPTCARGEAEAKQARRRSRAYGGLMRRTR